MRRKTGQIDGVVLVFRDVSERYLTNKNLEAAVRIRDEFLSIASHELNTPLTTLKLQLQLTRLNLSHGEDLMPEKLRATVELCYGQTERLAGLVEDRLDVSRIQSGRLNYQFEQVDLRQLVQENYDRFTGQFKAVNCPFEVVQNGPVEVSGDRFRIDQVLSNLLSNALKYAPEAR